MRLKFWGATRTVTGSAHLLSFDGHNVLLDCGLSQGSRKLARQLNLEFAAEPQTIDALILSHAHIDHCGNIPQLVKNGFSGPIHCTSATTDLTRVLLLDSAHIQEKDVEFVNRKHARRGEPPVEPLYTMADAESTLPLLRSHFYRRPFELWGGALRVEFYDAGHILGSAFVELGVRSNGASKTLVYSGDVGRANMPILRDPEEAPAADYLIMESTYGNRLHDDFHTAEEKLAEALRRVVARGGKVVIPAFSVGRTQELVYALNNLWNEGRLPRVPIYVDSPMSVNVTEIFRHHPECFDEEIKRVLLHDPDPFGFEGLIYVRDVATSKRINATPGPCVIISASGMAEAGRIQHHLANTIGDPRNAVLIIGFQAENTLGRKLVEKQPEVRIFGEMHKVAAEVLVFNAFSAHADSAQLRKFAGQAARGGRLRRIFLVHGEQSAALALQESLRSDLPGCEIHVPTRGVEFDL
jgi:metallo-beta-lactamase family protein